MNKVIISGNLTRDVELKYLPSGSALAQFGIASNRKIKKQDGNYADDTCFVDVKLFGRTAEVVNQFCKKGSKLLIEGKLTFESWTDQSGAKKSRLLIVGETIEFLGETQAQSNPKQEAKQVDMSQEIESAQPLEIQENEIPF